MVSGISGISAALRGVTASAARFDQAAARLGGAASADAPADATAIAAGSTAVSDAMVQMATSRFAFVASLRAAQSSNELLAQALQVGGYLPER